MDKAYQFSKIEPEIIEFWKTSGVFKYKYDSEKKPFTIILPPPNANGSLHTGHALFTVEDLLIRYKKMCGYNSYWVPGLDHAGFETQVVFEKELSKKGKSRFDFTRDELFEQIYGFVEEKKYRIKSQMSRMGFSLDWEFENYTLSDKSVKTVYKTFKKMFEEGLIYRGNRLVNYCTKHETGLSELESDYLEKKGSLYFVKYDIENSSSYLIVATVRPETIFVDAALCVNPTDTRYSDFVGFKAINPLTGTLLPIITDEAVKTDFGTGVLKITPLHDFTDFEIAKKHSLDFLPSIINTRGKMTERALEFAGLKVEEAREKVVLKLQTEGKIEKVEEYTHQVPCCYKCGTVLEPMHIPQWFVKVESLAKEAIRVVKEGKIKFYPSRFESVYFDWLEKILDWNISRQVVWGIKIPAFECQICKNWHVTEGKSPEKCECGSTEFKQDTDTFDTWFSSGQWPLITLGYPDSDEFKKHYPTDVLETAYDILFFWVTRMVMLGVYLTGEVPFRNVYLHGLVLDSQGKKMSKSKGNVIDPLDYVEKYGADSLRMALIMGAPAGNDQNFNEPRLVGCRNFGNKVWNMARFIEFSKPEDFDFTKFANFNISGCNYEDLKKIDSEIVSRHLEFLKNVRNSFEHFKFNEGAEEIYQYVWHEIADNLIEKAKNNKDLYPLLYFIFRDSLLVLHPIMPFITEKIWQSLYAKEKSTSISDTTWPGLEI